MQIRRHPCLQGPNSSVCLITTKTAEGNLSEKCRMPREHGIHWNDQDHPFEARSLDGAECVYEKKDGSRCSRPLEDIVHETLKETVPAPWASASEAMGRSGPILDLSEIMNKAFANVRAIKEMPSRQPWEVAVDALKSLDEEVSEHGPWTWRKYTLHDEAEIEDSRDRYEQCLASLNFLGHEYAVTVYRPGDKPWRFALVTWGAYLDKVVDEICDHMAQEYGS